MALLNGNFEQAFGKLRNVANRLDHLLILNAGWSDQRDRSQIGPAQPRRSTDQHHVLHGRRRLALIEDQTQRNDFIKTEIAKLDERLERTIEDLTPPWMKGW